VPPSRFCDFSAGASALGRQNFPDFAGARRTATAAPPVRSPVANKAANRRYRIQRSAHSAGLAYAMIPVPIAAACRQEIEPPGRPRNPITGCASPAAEAKARRVPGLDRLFGSSGGREKQRPRPSRKGRGRQMGTALPDPRREAPGLYVRAVRLCGATYRMIRIELVKRIGP
jgi:hypothetical protein